MWTLSGFADEISADLDEQCRVFNELGIGYVEFRGAWDTNVLDLDDDQLNHAAKTLAAHGLRTSSVGSPIGKIGIHEDFDAHLRRLDRALQVAARLAAPMVRIFSFWIPEGDDPAIHRDEVLRRMAALCDRAAGSGVMLVHENEKGIYGNIPRRCLDIVESVGSPALRLTWDAANFVQCGVRPHTEGYAMLRPHLEYVQVKDAVLATGTVVAAGDGDGEVRETMRALHADGFDGFFSLEPHLSAAGPLGGFSGCGRIGVATSLAAESDAVVEATGSHLTLRTSIVLANWRGRDAEALALTEARRQDVLRRGEGLWLAASDWGSAIRYNGLGRYEEALAAAERAVEAARGLGPSILLLAELIEAAAHSGHAERATGSLAQLAEIAYAADTDWALGTHARGAAMLAEGATAERLYREAIERLSHIKTRATLARTHLLYGEWLRRENRRVDAREQLRVADAMLAGMGMEAFAERARRELLATGETVRKRTVGTLDELTPQEVQVARLAAGGQTNPEIGAQLFLSPRTVEWHLGKVFGKLGVNSRRELRTALSHVDAAVVRR